MSGPVRLVDLKPWPAHQTAIITATTQSLSSVIILFSEDTGGRLPLWVFHVFLLPVAGFRR